MRHASKITVTSDQRQTLQKWARGRSTPARLVSRAQIVLLAADGMMNKDIAVKLDIDARRVARWRNRFAKLGIPGIEKDAPRSGRKPAKRHRLARRIIHLTTQSKPENATHWSTRSMAQKAGTNRSMVQRVWKANGLKPHLCRTFKISNDPDFADKVVDVVGLYLDPPEHALVLSVDEKTQIQALDRTQPGLPIKKGRCGTMTHDYKRNGTTTLFAAINAADGALIGACMKRHRHQEWIKFLNIIDESTPPDLDLHIIADNYAAHKHPKVKRWLERHKRVHVHFTPTSSSWLNIVERWFRELTDKRIRRGVFRSVAQLEADIMDYIARHNACPKAIAWTAKADAILEKVARAKAVFHNCQSE